MKFITIYNICINNFHIHTQAMVRVLDVPVYTPCLSSLYSKYNYYTPKKYVFERINVIGI